MQLALGVVHMFCKPATAWLSESCAQKLWITLCKTRGMPVQPQESQGLQRDQDILSKKLIL